MRILGTGGQSGALPCTVPAIMAADGHFRAVEQPSRERTVKRKNKQKGHSRTCYRYIDVVILWRVNWLLLATSVNSIYLC